jgi:hypothetical protein
METDEVKNGMTELAITRFGTVLKRTGTNGLPSRVNSPQVAGKHEPMVGTQSPSRAGRHLPSRARRRLRRLAATQHDRVRRPRCATAPMAVRTAIAEGRESACHTTSTAVSNASGVSRYQRNARSDDRLALARDRGARRFCIREKAERRSGYCYPCNRRSGSTTTQHHADCMVEPRSPPHRATHDRWASATRNITRDWERCAERSPRCRRTSTSLRPELGATPHVTTTEVVGIRQSTV